MSQDELKSVATSVKFSAAVPDVLLRRLAAARLFDSAVLAQESNRLGRPVCMLCVRSGDQTPGSTAQVLAVAYGVNPPASLLLRTIQACGLLCLC